VNNSLLNPQLSLNPLTDYHELVAFTFMVHALEAGTVVAIMASLVGWFMVLRRETFAGHTLAVMSFPGASGAALIGVPLALGYYVACGLAAALIALGSGTRGLRSRAQESALIGTVQVGALALGFLFLSLYQGILEDLETLLFGSFLGITEGQVEELLAVAAVTLGFLLLAGRPLLFSSLDEPVADARGVPVRLLHVCYLVLLGLAVAATAQITGALLVFALLVAPAAAAQKLTTSIPLSLVLSVVIALAVTWVGLGLSYFTNDSVGFFISTLAFSLYVLASAQEWVRRRVRLARGLQQATALA
jgi:zinc/manganese transport system permease protein